MTRFSYIDQIKGIAIFLVVIGHVMIFSFGIHFSVVQSMLVLFHMPVFFYASGFLAYKEGIADIKTLISRLAHKGKRIIIPWISVSIGMFVFSDRPFFSIFTSFYWFFYVLMVLTILHIIVEYLITKNIKFKIFGLGIWGLIPVSLFALKYLWHSGDMLFPFNQIIMYFFPFLLGWFSRKYSWLNVFVLHNSVLYILSIIIFLFCWLYADNLNVIFRIIGGLCAIVVLQSFFYNYSSKGHVNKMFDALCVLGKSSLAIYMLNNFFIPDLKAIILPFVIVPNGFIWELLLASVVAIPVIYTCLFVEKIFRRNKYLSHII